MREPAHLPIAPGQDFEIKVRERMRKPGAATQSVRPKQGFAGQMGRPASRLACADIDAGLAMINGEQLRVAIGEMNQAGYTLAFR